MDSAKTKIKDLIPEMDMDKELKDVQEDRFKLQRMSEKIREVCGEGYVFILFDAKYPPKIGDIINIGNLSATFKKPKK